MSASISFPVRSTEPIGEIAESNPDIVAAGVVPWRIDPDDGLQVLLIHRPKHKDWSLPKGKVDDGETIAEAAVREAKEEANLKVTLGIPLPCTHYFVGKKSKVVYYWAAHVEKLRRVSPDGKEVDIARWYSPSKALKKLTNDADQAPIKAVVDAYEQGLLKTTPFLLVRHAKAKPRNSWTRSEGERTLARTGFTQARALARMLTVWQPERLVSSRWTRCVQTVQPYAAAMDMSIKKQTALTEHAADRDPDKAQRILLKQFNNPKSTLVCSHRPVMPTLLKALKTVTPKELREFLPQENPYLAPGEAIILHRALDAKRRWRAVAVEIHKPFED
ncbi:hypothetical protein HMPREF2128_10675 [Pseudoglutamicibacter albus DNF00011]|uniref:Nudix hydrolase domain-containing protein n=1 Tax=Pseudoglutamicibacter albus DNF00011 TaxID=1401063 RepID=A0A095YAN4_9MICC|nr:NUDIX domain-containing protein [Pseudoglutamicibacter albus]KGF19515.1 hypothetical protein HMPREF2128_10675 [Pseudoglutamicibacter albus DNF00011]